MDLKKPLVLLALVGSLVACGDNTNFDRGETNCDSSAQEGSNQHDASCEEEGPEDD
jgi:predicted small lipoprotein YifL